VSFDTDTDANAFILSVFLFCVHAHVTQYFSEAFVCEYLCTHVTHTHTQNPLNVEETHECGDE